MEPDRNTRVLRKKRKESFTEKLPSWVIVLLTILGALLILVTLHQIGILESAIGTRPTLETLRDAPDFNQPN